MKTFPKTLLYITSLIITLILISPTTSVKKNSIQYLILSENETVVDNITYIDCSDKQDRDQLGYCVLENMNCEQDLHNCTCKEGYISDVRNNFTYAYCSFEQKKQLTAFLLEFFLGFGAGHFYRKAYLMAGLKLGAFVFSIYVLLSFYCMAIDSTNCSDCSVFLVTVIYGAYSLGIGFWYVFDLVYFAKNNYQDYSHSYPIDMKHW